MNKVCTMKWVSLVAVLLLVIAGVRADDPEANPTPQQPMIGQQAPTFSLIDVNDQQVSSADVLGSYVVIHIAASW